MLNVYILCFALNSQRSEVAVEDEIPPKLQDLVAEKREEMLSYLAEADDEFGERFLFSEEPVTVEDIRYVCLLAQCLSYYLKPVLNQ